jgi:ketosteroid isomerase-like protein
MCRTLVSMLCIVTASALLLKAQPSPADADCHTVRDKTDPVWRAIGMQYAKLADAIKQKDIDKLIALYTADFHAYTETGEVWSREKSLQYQRNGMAQVVQTSHISNTIVRLSVCGEKATATVMQLWYRTQHMAGKVRKVETNTVQDEEWTKTPDGWKRGDISNVAEGVAFVDGKRVDPTKPYDPDTPPYEPFKP